MVANTISKIKKSILIVSSIYDNIECIKTLNDYEYVIIIGNICYPANDLKDVKSRIDKFEQIKTPNTIYVVGEKDLLLLSKLLKTGKYQNISNWILNKPHMVIAEFVNRSKILIMNGGIVPTMKSTSDLNSSLEIVFASLIDGTPWYRSYAGQLGYVISNNPTAPGKPRFTGYTTQIGSPYEANTTYAVEANRFGIVKNILI